MNCGLLPFEVIEFEKKSIFLEIFVNFLEVHLIEISSVFCVVIFNFFMIFNFHINIIVLDTHFK